MCFSICNLCVISFFQVDSVVLEFSIAVNQVLSICLSIFGACVYRSKYIFCYFLFVYLAVLTSYTWLYFSSRYFSLFFALLFICVYNYFSLNQPSTAQHSSTQRMIQQISVKYHALIWIHIVFTKPAAFIFYAPSTLWCDLPQLQYHYKYFL